MTQTERPSKSKIKPMTPGVSSGARLRAYLAGATLSIGILGLGYRAWALQVDDNEHYKLLAERQHATTVETPAPRGDVRDVNGEPLAVSADTDSIWANPREIRDVTATADKLAGLMQTDPASLEAKLGTGRKFVWLDRHVDQAIADAVRAAKIPGIEIAREPKRWYPGRTLAGPIIGRADIDGNGVDGLELSMNEYLTGSHGENHAVRDARGHRAFSDGLSQPEAGGSIRLTLDRNIQAIAETNLAETVISHAAKSGVAVVLDVSTGHVLGMATYPTYDPNRPEGVGNGRNRPVTDSFEAGSVMKVFTIAAALEAGTVKPDTELDVQNGSMMIPGRKTPIRDVHPFRYLTVSEIIKHSSNVGAAKIALRLGAKPLYDQLIKFGFGARTKIELPGETPGMVRNGSKWRDVELATMAFGYGLTVTPIQIAGALAAVGNDGIYNPPRIVDEVTRDGRVVYRGLGEPRRVIKAETARQLRAMLASVFEGGKEPGTAGAAGLVVAGYKCGGKTGTAHKYDPETKQYSEHRYLSSFIGLAPIENPRLAIVVLIDDPSEGDYFGGRVAGPVFTKVASEALRYLGVPGTSLQCPPSVPGVNPALVVEPKTCTIPAPSPAKVKPASAAAPAAKATSVSDGNSPNLGVGPVPH